MFLKESPRHFCFSRNILIITVLQFYMAPEMTGYLVFTLTACSFSICFFTLSPFFFFFPVTFSYQFLTMFFSLVYFIISKDPSIWFHPEKWTFKKKKKEVLSHLIANCLPQILYICSTNENAKKVSLLFFLMWLGVHK